MKWFKHDTDASMDAKLQEVMLDYGLEGYGLYWYCIELIAGKVDAENLTFSLEHDARIIARNTGSTAQKVTEMMTRFVDLGLFQNNDGLITCLRLAKRLNKSMTSNPEMRKAIEAMNKNHDSIMTQSGLIMQEENRTEENRTDKEEVAPQKKLTKAELLAKKVRDNPEAYPALNCIDDELLLEWAKLRSKKGASDSDRALKRIESTLEALRTTGNTAPDYAISKQCDSGWTTIEVDYFVKGNSSTGQQVAVHQPQQSLDDVLNRAF